MKLGGLKYLANYIQFDTEPVVTNKLIGPFRLLVFIVVYIVATSEIFIQV